MQINIYKPICLTFALTNCHIYIYIHNIYGLLGYTIYLDFLDNSLEQDHVRNDPATENSAWYKQQLWCMASLTKKRMGLGCEL